MGAEFSDQYPWETLVIPEAAGLFRQDSLPMNGQLFVPPKTQAILAAAPVRGTRHMEMKDIALSLIGNQHSPDDVFTLLRNRYEPDVTDEEISGVIAWVLDKNPKPSEPRNGKTQVPLRNGYQPWKPHVGTQQPSDPPVRCLDPIGETKRLLRTPCITEMDLLKRSEPLPEWNQHFAHVLCCCYEAKDRVNVVTNFILREEKANPSGNGATFTIEEWIDRKIPPSEAGGWMRMNPVCGGIADENVTAFRFVLLENDILPPSLQLNLLARLPLPISALIWSGGVSYHAWVRVDCVNLESYRTTSARLLKMLDRFGFDQANKNPSRLSRVPGVERKIGALSDGRQRLVYLNSNPKKEPILC